MIGIPRKERIWVSYYDISGTKTHVLTSDTNCINWSMFKIQTDGSAKIIGKGKNPIDLEKRFIG